MDERNSDYENIRSEAELNQSRSAPFSASAEEIILAFLTFFLAYIYVATDGLWFGVFTLGFIAFAEIMFKNEKRTFESNIWLGCLLVIVASLCFEKLSISRVLGFDHSRVWDRYDSRFFAHVFAVYWALARGNRLICGESSRMLPLDGLNGFVVFPFENFFNRIQAMVFGLKKMRIKGKKTSASQVLITIAGILAVLFIFIFAVNQLGEADDTFYEWKENVFGLLRFDINDDVIMNCFLSLPVAAYLFGLLSGIARKNKDELRLQGEKTDGVIRKLRAVPTWLWIACLTVFAVTYAAFFVLQGSYLFGAFTRTLPEGFIVSQYARQGFFELCKVMGANFALLWCVTRLSNISVKENKSLLILCVVILAESMLFAVVAFSKLALYIDCFGFTPLRLESSWLVCVLFAGCVAALVTLITKKKTLKNWMIFSAVTLALLHLY